MKQESLVSNIQRHGFNRPSSNLKDCALFIQVCAVTSVRISVNVLTLFHGLVLFLNLISLFAFPLFSTGSKIKQLKFKRKLEVTRQQSCVYNNVFHIVWVAVKRIGLILFLISVTDLSTCNNDPVHNKIFIIIVITTFYLLDVWMIL